MCRVDNCFVYFSTCEYEYALDGSFIDRGKDTKKGCEPLLFGTKGE